MDKVEFFKDILGIRIFSLIWASSVVLSFFLSFSSMDLVVLDCFQITVD